MKKKNKQKCKTKKQHLSNPEWKTWRPNSVRTKIPSHPRNQARKKSSSPYKRQNTESCTNTFLKGDFFFLLKITFAGFITVHCELHVSNNWMELYMANREVALWPLTYLHVWFWHLTLHCMWRFWSVGSCTWVNLNIGRYSHECKRSMCRSTISS